MHTHPEWISPMWACFASMRSSARPPTPNHQLPITTPWSNPTMVGAKVMSIISHAFKPPQASMDLTAMCNADEWVRYAMRPSVLGGVVSKQYMQQHKMVKSIAQDYMYATYRCCSTHMVQYQASSASEVLSGKGRRVRSLFSRLVTFVVAAATTARHVHHVMCWWMEETMIYTNP